MGKICDRFEILHKACVRRTIDSIARLPLRGISVRFRGLGDESAYPSIAADLVHRDERSRWAKKRHRMRVLRTHFSSICAIDSAISNIRFRITADWASWGRRVRRAA